jgi:hypothetical protein
MHQQRSGEGHSFNQGRAAEEEQDEEGSNQEKGSKGDDDDDHDETLDAATIAKYFFCTGGVGRYL